MTFMAGIFKGMTELVGNTPLVEAVNLEKKEGLKARLLLKLEYFNPAGSVKDRVGKAMIEDAEASGRLKRAPLSLSRPPEIQELAWHLSRRPKATG